VTIYVRDVLARYDADVLRYYLAVAGPETQDVDFTWAEFVRRNNDELVAKWGNLVNRVLSITHREFAEVPEADALADADRELLVAVENGFRSVGDLIEQVCFKAALREALRLADLANKYFNDQEPWRRVKDDPCRAAAVLYTALKAVDNLKILFTPFLPFSSQKLHELMGYEGYLAGPLSFKEVTEPRDSVHRILTGDYASWGGRWQPTQLAPGQRLLPPNPLFEKLDESVVGEELARLEPSNANAGP
jgi:methionyl-tRNA synthetase